MIVRSLAHRLGAASLVFLVCAVASMSPSLRVTWQLALTGEPGALERDGVDTPPVR